MGLALGTAYTVRPTDAIPGGALLVWVLICRRKQILKVLVGVLPPLIVFMTVNELAYHRLISNHYTQTQNFSGWSTFSVALAGNLVSPSRGLIIFCPLVLLSVVGVITLKRSGQLTGLWSALAVIPVLHLIVISTFHQWWAGDAFGPRFFTDLMPVFAVLAVPAVARLSRDLGRRDGETRLPRRKLFYWFSALAMVWSVAVNMQGAILRSSWCWNNEPTDIAVHPSKVWSLSDPQFLRGIRRLVFGPNRSSELIRDGTQHLGCPVEEVLP